MSLLDGYRASLKPLEIEEPIDVYVHRPLGYLVAKLSFHTPISPDLITLLSIFAGMSAGVVMLSHAAYKMQIGAALIFLSAVLDCADGQLARMRKTSSAFGRMLDGTADLVTMGAVVPATVFLIWRSFATPWWAGITAVMLCIVTIVTSSFHTTMYDHYKNVFLRLTGPYQEAEDYEAALARFTAKDPASLSLLSRICYPVYLFYLKGQRDYVMKFDPFTSSRLTLFPPFDPGRAAIYRELAGAPMKVWRTTLGFGSMVFGLALFNALEHPEIFLLYRLVVLNAVFYLYVRPMQRQASREAFRRMGLTLPDQVADTAGLAIA